MKGSEGRGSRQVGYQPEPTPQSGQDAETTGAGPPEHSTGELLKIIADSARDHPFEDDPQRVAAWDEIKRRTDDEENSRAALRAITEIQPRTLQELREAGVVFDRAPLPSTVDAASVWQGIAFWIYTALCEADAIARGMLNE